MRAKMASMLNSVSEHIAHQVFSVDTRHESCHCHCHYHYHCISHGAGSCRAPSQVSRRQPSHMASCVDLPWHSYGGVALLALHLLSIALCTYSVSASLYHSTRTLPVSQDVKDRVSRRRQMGWVFYGLALLSLTAAASVALQHAALSFERWAYERGLASTAKSVGPPSNSSPHPPWPHLTPVSCL